MIAGLETHLMLSVAIPQCHGKGLMREFLSLVMVNGPLKPVSPPKTLFYGAPAVITFRVPTKATPQEAYSTPIRHLDILADRPPEKKFEWRLLAKYGSLVSVISIVTLFIYLVATPSKCNAAKASKKKC